MSIAHDVWEPLFEPEQDYGSVVNEDDVETVASGIDAHVVHRWIMARSFRVATIRSAASVGGGNGEGCVYYGG